MTLMINYPFEHCQSWTLTYIEGNEPTWKSFKTIELASEFMNSLGVDDLDIDDALVDMYSLRHALALFEDNKYHHSEVG